MKEVFAQLRVLVSQVIVPTSTKVNFKAASKQLEHFFKRCSSNGCVMLVSEAKGASRRLCVRVSIVYLTRCCGHVNQPTEVPLVFRALARKHEGAVSFVHVVVPTLRDARTFLRRLFPRRGSRLVQSGQPAIVYLRGKTAAWKGVSFKGKASLDSLDRFIGDAPTKMQRLE